MIEEMILLFMANGVVKISRKMFVIFKIRIGELKSPIWINPKRYGHIFNDPNNQFKIFPIFLTTNLRLISINRDFLKINLFKSRKPSKENVQLVYILISKVLVKVLSGLNGHSRSVFSHSKSKAKNIQ